jgi:putative methyltransferase (TIGR04325 family)
MSNYIFQESFPTYERALEFCTGKNINKSFPAEIWKARQLEFLRKAKLGLSPRVESITKILESERDLSIVDFGGGSGWLFQYLGTLGFKSNCLMIVETEESISWFKEKDSDFFWITNNAFFHFELTGDKNVFYSNSCIQYLGNLEAFFEEILTKSWSYLILEDVPNLETQDCWTCQNYYGYMSPYHFFKKDNLISLIESHGFELTQESNYKSIYPAEWKYQIAERNTVTEPGIAKTLVFRKQK